MEVRRDAKPIWGVFSPRDPSHRPTCILNPSDRLAQSGGTFHSLELFDAGVPCIRSVARPLKTAGTFYWNCLTPASCIRSAFPVRWRRRNGQLSNAGGSPLGTNWETALVDRRLPAGRTGGTRTRRSATPVGRTGNRARRLVRGLGQVRSARRRLPAGRTGGTRALVGRRLPRGMNGGTVLVGSYENLAGDETRTRRRRLPVWTNGEPGRRFRAAAWRRFWRRQPGGHIACRAGRDLPGDVLPGAPGNGLESPDLRHLLGEA